MSNLLDIQNLTKSYKEKQALKGVSLKIEKGKIFGLLGPNGAGKSTLIRIINRIIEKNDGVVLLNAVEMIDTDVQKIGYLPEERGLYKNMTIEGQALYLAQLKGLSKKEAIERLDFWLRKFEILDWKKKKIQELSKGMAQKVQFIITVLHEPELLILDEPFSGFDPVNAKLIAKEILNLKQQGVTIIFSTHRMESVEELCDEICLMNHGQVLIQGETEAVKREFSDNTYRVTFKENELLSVETLHDYKIIAHNKQELKIQLEEGQDSNELLKNLLSLGKITAFEEVIPTINDIFLKTVTEAS